MSREMKLITVFMVVAILGFVFSVRMILVEIDDYGGLKGIAIEVGKNIKDITAEVSKYKGE